MSMSVGERTAYLAEIGQNAKQLSLRQETIEAVTTKGAGDALTITQAEMNLAMAEASFNVICEAAKQVSPETYALLMKLDAEIESPITKISVVFSDPEGRIFSKLEGAKIPEFEALLNEFESNIKMFHMLEQQ